MRQIKSEHRQNSADFRRRSNKARFFRLFGHLSERQSSAKVRRGAVASASPPDRSPPRSLACYVASSAPPCRPRSSSAYWPGGPTGSSPPRPTKPCEPSARCGRAVPAASTWSARPSRSRSITPPRRSTRSTWRSPGSPRATPTGGSARSWSTTAAPGSRASRRSSRTPNRSTRCAPATTSSPSTRAASAKALRSASRP